MARVITALFTTQSKALRAVEDLVAHDYPEQDISLLMSEATQGRHFAMKERTKAPEGMAVGAAILGIIGAILLGMTSVGLIAAPDAGMFAVGQFISVLAGFGSGALIGGLIGGLIGLCMTEHEVQFSATLPKEHGILLGVLSGNKERTDEALKLMQSNGATHIRTENVKPESTKIDKKAA
jgi:hypothetical protein